MTDIPIISRGKRVIVKQGKGPKDTICILLSRSDGKGVGLGDHVQSLPVIYELVKNYAVTIYANNFYRSLYERAGCIFKPHTDIYYGMTDDLVNDYGAVYSMIEWSFDAHTASKGLSMEDHTTAFAAFFSTKRPASFDFITALGAQNDSNLRELNTVIYAPQSSFDWRNLSREDQIYFLLKKEYPSVLWLGIPERSERSDIGDLQQLIDIVYNSSAVLAVDNGIMHLACALGTPMFGVFGGTDERVLCEPYDFYLSQHADRRMYFRALPKASNECTSPCWWQTSRGFHVDGKCQDHADCMMDIDKDFLLSSFGNFLLSHNIRSTISCLQHQ